MSVQETTISTRHAVTRALLTAADPAVVTEMVGRTLDEDMGKAVWKFICDNGPVLVDRPVMRQFPDSLLDATVFACEVRVQWEDNL
jgi:hypothetical protein